MFKMLNFKNLSKSLFQINTDGRTSFHPWGKWSKGYIVPSDEMHAEIEGYWIKINAIGMIIGIPLMYLGLEYCIPYILVFLICHYFLIRKKIQGLAISNEKYRSDEAFRNWVREHSLAFLIFGFLFCLAFSFAGLIVALNEPWLGLFCILLFLLMAISYFRMILAKIFGQEK
jgi:hypothetical protein